MKYLLINLLTMSSSRIVRDDVAQLTLIETAIERSFAIGHGLSLLHGTLCALPNFYRSDFADCLRLVEYLFLFRL